MPHLPQRRPPLTCILWLLLALAGPAFGQGGAGDGVPLGAAANWAVGERLLADGDARGALPYLHLAYRGEPDEPQIALGFQEALAAEGFIEDAIGVMNRLLAAQPDSVSWRLRRSSLQLRAGRPEQALEDLEAVRNAGAATLEVITAEARILSELGRADQALDIYRDGLARFPAQGAGLYLGMADVLQQAGEPAGIPPLMEEAIAAYPADPGLRLVQLRALAALSRDAEALAAARLADEELFRTALEPAAAFDPETGEIVRPPAAPETSIPVPADGFQVELADFYARHGRTAEALAVLEPLARSGELDQQPSLWLARLLLGTGRVEEGAALVGQINERWPDAARGWYLRGKLAEDRTDWPAAVTFHRRAVSLAERDPELRVALVRALLVAGERELAAADPDAAGLALREDLRTQATVALTLIPDGDHQGQLVLGYAFRTLDDLQRAAERFGLAGASPDLRRTALIQQSICLDEAGRPGRARQALETLHREYPDDPEVANSLGYFLAEKGQDLETAERLVLLALAAEPGNGAFLDSMGWVYHRQGRQDEALDYLIRAVNVLPADPVILEHLGTVLLVLGQPQEARNAFTRSLEAGGDAQRLEAAIAAADSAAGSRP